MLPIRGDARPGLGHAAVDAGAGLVGRYRRLLRRPDDRRASAGPLGVSPKKTWAGFAGGLLAAALVGALGALWLGLQGWWLLAAIGAFLAVVEQGGDLAKSAFKRRFGVKDSSNLIPGHGGVLDRVDGLLAVLVAVAGLMDRHQRRGQDMAVAARASSTDPTKPPVASPSWIDRLDRLQHGRSAGAPPGAYRGRGAGRAATMSQRLAEQAQRPASRASR